MEGLYRQFEAAIERVILDPQYHDLLTLVKGVRNGIVYGTKIRFPHALVMIFLFRHGSFRKKIRLVLSATRQHARNLGLFALSYKSTMLLLRRYHALGRPLPAVLKSQSLAASTAGVPGTKEGRYDTFLAGLVGGYLVFGRTIDNSVSQQIVIYIFARVALAWAGLAFQPTGDKARGGGGSVAGSGGGFGLLDAQPGLKDKVTKHAWTAFASLSWATVMYMFRWHPETLQPSLYSSMHYIYEASDHWDSFRNFLIHNK